MGKTQKVERLTVVLSDGTKSDIEKDLVKKYKLIPGGVTPFSRAETETVLRTPEQKTGPKDWTPEDDTYLVDHWPIVTKAELARRLSVTPIALTKRYNMLIAAQEAEKKKKKKKSRSSGKKTGKARSKKTK